jgi:hypothetical protein
MNIIQSLSIHIAPILAIIGYLFYPKELRIEPTLLYSISIIYNSFLVIFSAWTFISLSLILYNNGLVFRSGYYFQNQYYERTIFWFYVSKYLEFFDTFLLYLNGKNPIFLQKYHHIGALICWHLHYVYKIDSVWIPSFVNSFVHTIMYLYYLGCLLKINQVRFIKQYITSLQLIQLIIPNFICLYFYMPPVESNFNYNLIIFFVGYVSILIILFLQFYYQNYIKSKTM